MTTPSFQGMLNGIVPIGALDQVHSMACQLPQEGVLMTFCLGNALLEDTKSIRMVSHFDHPLGHRAEDRIRDGGKKASEKSLHHMRSWLVKVCVHVGLDVSCYG